MSISDSSKIETPNASQADPVRPNATECDISSAQPGCDTSLLNDRHRAAIELLLTGATVAQVAQSLTIHRATLHRWTTLPEFAAALRARRAQLTQQSADRFRSLLTAALDTFQKQITDPYVPTAYRAARGLLALAQLNKLLLPAPDPAPFLSETPASEQREDPDPPQQPDTP